MKRQVADRGGLKGFCAKSAANGHFRRLVHHGGTQHDTIMSQTLVELRHGRRRVFKKGHSIRLEIASSAFPKFDRNPSTGEPLGKTARLERSEQKVLHDREHPSYVVLPIVPRKP